MSKKLLFDDFPEVSAKQWKQKIQMELEGASYESLLFQSEEGIAVKPFYHRENFKKNNAPLSPTHWNCCERFVITKNTSAKIINEALQKGAESLWLIITSERVDLIALLKTLPLEKTPIYIEFEFLPERLAENLTDFLKQKKHQLQLGFDTVGQLAHTGNWFQNLKNDQAILKGFLQKEIPVTLTISTEIYQQAGANITQQLAYALAHANEYLHFLQTELPELLKTHPIKFKIATGSNYFFEIAKLKALRKLYVILAEAYDAQEKIEILAFPTQRNKTLFDYNVNLLRTTTESMSNILGGANDVCNFPYDDIYHHDNAFGRRIARNQSLILKNESYFDKVANPTDGSYYIAEITQQLSEKALGLFKSIERGGGFLAQLKAGTIQRKIKESAAKTQQQFDEGKKILVGSNNYQNPEDAMKSELEKNPFRKHQKRKTLLEPIVAIRLAEKIEQQRLQKEK